MEILKKKRTVKRRFFTKIENEFTKLLTEAEKDEEDTHHAKQHKLSTIYKSCETSALELATIEKEIENKLYSDEEANVEEIYADFEAAQVYRDRWAETKVRYETWCSQFEEDTRSNADSYRSTVLDKSKSQQRRFQLPKIELRKFDGEIQNWIPFWGQFSKIDEDVDIDSSDKFQYLIQATVPDSKARQLVESFPPSGSNYHKAIEHLKERFAREDLLIEHYIRGLLQLVLNNENISLRAIYDQLSTQIQALESLNVTSDKYAPILLPMVESVVPTEILRAWERTRDRNDKDPLNNLLKFIKREADSEEHIIATRQGFESPSTSYKEPTANCIVASSKQVEKQGSKCLWCDKENHHTLECSQVLKLTIEERKKLIEKKRACFYCLKIGHMAKFCRTFVKCLICGRRHNTVLCTDSTKQGTSSKQEQRVEKTSGPNIGVCQKNKTTLLQTVLLNVIYFDKKIVTRALLDSGAQKSYIKQELAGKLGITPSSSEIVSHCLFGGIETKKSSHNNYKFNIESLDCQFQLPISALGQEKICGALPRLQSSKICDKLLHLGIQILDKGEDDFEIGLLLGADVIGHILTGNIIKLEGSLVAIETKLGWSLQGTLSHPSANCVTTYFNHFTISELWDLEPIGIKDPSEVKSKQRIENETIQFFKNTVQKDVDGRYEVHLPWREGFPEQLGSNNKELSYKRLQSTTKKLMQTGNLDRYNKVFEDWIEEGIIEVVPGNEKGLYLPHHAVIKESSTTTPVRPVFDASAKNYHGNSLNFGLEKGSNLLELIPKLLINFRKGSFGITSDIRKAFLQISVVNKDRDFLQFLWWKNCNNPRELQTYRHKRVVFGVTSSPFLLGATINHHLDNVVDVEKRSIAQVLKSSFYVDNCVTSADSKEEVAEFISSASQLMKEGMFDLRGWVTGPSDQSETLSVLGLMWDSKQDFLQVDPHLSAIDEKNITKRVLLSYAQTIFDPIGFTSPVSLIPKILLQKVWQIKIGWDEKLPKCIAKEFMAWKNKLDALRQIIIPRRLTVHKLQDCELSLHVFCDASKYAYSACVFLRSEQGSNVHVQLVLAKARVAPVKEVTIPRLELISAVIAVRLYSQVVEALNIKCHALFWTDSAVALTWIKKESNWSVFVNNRVREILSVTKKEQWQHIPGSWNPADLPSRGCHADKLGKLRWWEGPHWLRQSSDHWPKGEVNEEYGQANCEAVNLITNVTKDTPWSNSFIYFSKYSKIVRCMTWIIRFIKNCQVSTVSRKGEISYDEFEQAELKLLKMVQHERYADGSIYSTKQLECFIDLNGVIRVKTRLLLGDDVEPFKCPILLPGDHVIVQRLIHHKHCMLQHVGTTTVLSNLREKYWVTSARRSIQRVIAGCLVCRKFKAKAAYAPTAQLPANRITATRVFEVVGVDLAGPLFLKTAEKCWIVIITCAVFRAVHLELVMSLSTESFLMALRRFIARRGRVRTIYSDNGTNFQGGHNLLKNLDWNLLQAQANILQFEWKFNVPSGPWWGGFWERLIRMLKDLLRRMLGKSVLTYVELETLLCDCEATMNSRPLTYIPQAEGLVPLTPACFLQDITSTDVRDLDLIDSKSLNQRLKLLNKLRADLRQRFRNEYLGQLVQKRQSPKGSNLQVGDVVLIESATKRQFWPFGLIVEMIAGRDGVARVAKVKTKDTVLTRPLQRLYPLEMRPGGC